MPSARKLRVMVAGIGGASLGTEILKCLALAGRYEVFGCDISPTAYGLYDPHLQRTFVVDRHAYVASVIEACRETSVRWLIPGGEQPMVLLGAASHQLQAAGISLIANAPDVIRTFSDKVSTFERLAALGFSIPLTMEVTSSADLAHVAMPCIVKPAQGTGGSAMVLFATDRGEALVYVNYIRHIGGRPLVQEYITPDEGEYTVGVLSSQTGAVVGSIALRRALDSKLSVLSRGRGGLISSGYSQGYIGEFRDIRNRAEAIATAVGSRGALNIQGRLRNGEFVPFEINPRLSASTYLRAMAGFNEVDLLLQHLAFDAIVQPDPLREGWYLRSFTEIYVPPDRVRS